MPKKKKSKKTIKRDKNTKKLVHQIYGIFDDGIPLKDIRVFYENVQKTKEFCKSKGYQYKMWNLKQCVDLVNKYYPQYLDLWNDFILPIQRADFIRYLILHKYGGIYIDCDIHPLRSLDNLFKKDIFFVHWNDDKRKLPYNAVIGSKSKQNILLKICEESKNSFYEKSKQNIYKSWKGRFVFQTTGHRMLERVLKKHNMKDKVLDILKIKTKNGKIVSGKNPYFEDNNASVWFKK